MTSVSRTLLDLAGVLAAGPLERAVERSIALRVFDLGALRALLAACPRSRGAGTLKRILASTYDEPTLTRSELEALMLDLCRARDRAAGGHREFHLTPQAFERDRERDARLTMLGYRVVRFTHRRLVGDPVAVAATIRALLA